ncbi:MAG: helix-turn-helix transcriptional regulator [Solirubrobacteraceae bacterium]
MGRGLLQRDSELAAFGRHLHEVRAGSGRVAVVEGPPGVGKSSLLRAVARAADESGMRVLRAWASPLEQQAGWGIARQLFAPVAGAAGGAEWDALDIGAARLARRVLDPDPIAPAPTGDAMHAASHGLTCLATDVAERTPTVMVVDDVHWADAPSLRWLVQLTRRLPDLHLGVLCARRSGERSVAPALLDELLAAAPEPPVRPRPLGPDAVESIVAERLPTAGTAFAHACHAASAGNPFMLGALIDELLAQGIEPTAEVAARLTTFGPEQVARTVSLQLSRLPGGAADLARAFAVLGRGALLRQAASLAELDAAAAELLADHLAAVGILGIEGDGRGLTHPLVESALYRSLPVGERSLLHRRAADLLAGEQADVETVGLHLVHAEPAADPQTVTRLHAAAGRAHVRGAPEAAATFLQRALTEPPAQHALIADLQCELGLELAAEVQPGARHHLREAVALAVTPEQRLRIALSGSRAVGLAGHFDDAIEIARQGLAEQAGDADLREQLELEMVCSMMLAADTVQEGRDRVRAHGPAHRDSLWRIPLAWEAAAGGCCTDDVRRLLEPAIDAVTPPRGTDSLVSTWAKFILIANGDFDMARRLCDGVVELARPQGWLIALAHGSFVRAIVYVHMGRIHEARADAETSFRFKMTNSPPAALIWSLFPLVEALTELGEFDEADSALKVGLPTGDPPEACLSGAHLLERRAQLRMAQGRYDEAHADLVRAADWWQRLHIRHPAAAAWRVIDAEALVALGDRRTARDLAVAHLELADRTGLPEPRGAGLRALALTAEPEEAVELLERSVALLAASPARLEHTRALVALGAALRRVNRRRDAREPLRQALDQSQHGGMRLLADRARRELQAAGARPRRTALTGIDSLTPSERQVAHLVAQGHGNREIAQRLYVTRRTVETHLTHAFGKLGVSSRSDLVELLTVETAREQ